MSKINVRGSFAGDLQGSADVTGKTIGNRVAGIGWMRYLHRELSMRSLVLYVGPLQFQLQWVIGRSE